MIRILPALRALLFALATLASGLITGCGLKGDLVLPDTAPNPDSATSSGKSAPGQDEDDEAEDAGKHQQ